jgi:parvulin-like peptidyl-prolyl isomerase
MNLEQSTINSISEIGSAQIVRHLKLSRQMPNVLKGLIEQKIIEQKATEENITIGEEELQQAADRFRLEHHLITSQDTLAWLQKYSLSVTEFEELIYDRTLARKLAQHLFGDRVEAHFSAHQLDYTKAIIYEIVLQDSNLAMELFYSIQEREFSFWELAHQYNENDELRRQGGYRGIVAGDRLKPEIATAIFASDRYPQVLKPISVGKYTYLIYVEEIIKPSLDSSLHYKIMNQLFSSWIEQQRERVLTKNIIASEIFRE